MTTNVVTCTETTTVDDALELLLRHRISGMPVVDSGNHLVGVVSDFDLFTLDDVAFSP